MDLLLRWLKSTEEIASRFKQNGQLHRKYALRCRYSTSGGLITQRVRDEAGDKIKTRVSICWRTPANKHRML